MKIYKFYKGEIVSCEVKRETGEYYWTEFRHPAFGYSTRIKKSSACTTSEAAIQEAIGERIKTVSDLSTRLENVKSELLVLDTLAMESQLESQKRIVVNSNTNDSQINTIVGAESPLRLGIENDELVIRAGINTLDGHESHPSLPAMKFDDRYEWARDVIEELMREKEDGSTPLTDLLDSAMIAAIENGSIGVSEDSPTHVGTCEICGGEFMAIRHTNRGQVCPECA